MNLVKLAGLILVVLALSACDRFQKNIEVDLPDYESELVVESYLKQGKPITVLLTKSSTYFGEVGLPQIPDAEVTINGYGHSSFSTKLYYRSNVPFIPGEYYNYQSDMNLPYYGENSYYLLTIRDNKTGQVITGKTEFLLTPYIESIEARFRESDNKAFLLVKFQDVEPDKRNYYRLLVQKKLDDGKRKLVNDIKFEGNVKTNNQIAIGTNYELQEGDEAQVRLFHLSKEYYDFLRTMDNAKQSNQNPFTQPTPVKSTVDGGLGVFTFLAFDERMFVVVKDE